MISRMSVSSLTKVAARRLPVMVAVFHNVEDSPICCVKLGVCK